MCCGAPCGGTLPNWNTFCFLLWMGEGTENAEFGELAIDRGELGELGVELWGEIPDICKIARHAQWLIK